MARDRFATRAAIIESAAELVAAHGVGAVKINALAESAKCDKVLIYRYFGGLGGVLEAVGSERMLWPRVAVVEGGGGDEEVSLAHALETVVLEEWAALASGDLMLQAGAAEVVGMNALGRATGVQRADRHAEIITALRAKHRVPPYVDLAALLELLSAALALFAMRAPREDTGARSASEGGAQRLDANTPEGWRRIEKTVGIVVRALLDS
ncbi:MAG: TetR/AcrR family transcriptional regulator [Gemmatimonadota bacterium]